MNLILAITKSFLISIVCFWAMCLVLKRVGLVKFPITPAALTYGLLGTICSLLHEFGHIAVANFWGLRAVWERSLNMRITTIPPIPKVPPITQLTLSLGGPFVSLIVVIVVWTLLKYAKKPSTVLVLSNLLFAQGLGGFGTFLLIIAADSRIFMQSLSVLTPIPFDVTVRILFILWVIWTWVVVKRTIKGYQYLKSNS